MKASQMHREIYDQVTVTSSALAANEAAFTAAEAPLSRCSSLYLVGTGASLNACKVARYAFVRYVGLHPHVVAAAELEELAPQADDNCLFVLVSQSGMSYETKLAVNLLRSRGAKLWAITNNLQSDLAASAELIFDMAAGEEVSSATKTYVNTLMILYRLAAWNRPAVIRELERLPASVAKTLTYAEPAIGQWASALLAEPVVYLLGAAAGAHTAEQGALLLQEKFYTHAIGLSLSEFRHGHIEAVSEGLPVIVIAATEELWAEAEVHARFLQSIGANVFIVRPIGHADIASDYNTVAIHHESDDLIGQIVAVLPLQLLSERLASQRGYEVDGFKFISKIVGHY